jgi:hypothetical protein
VFVVSDGPEFGTEGAASRWDWVDSRSTVKYADDAAVKLVGGSSLRADVGPYGGGRVELRYRLTRDEVQDVRQRKRLDFWFRAENPAIPCWQNENPIVTLSGGGTVCRFKPKVEIINWTDHPESRDGWLLISVPLAGDANWALEGPMPKTVEHISFGFDSWGARPFRVWLDGMRFD